MTKRATTPRVIESPYLTSDEAVVYLRLRTLSALYWLIKEHKLPHGRRGSLYLFDTRDLDAWVHGHDSALALVRATRGA